jgi:two-component system response regulator YesN
MLKVLLVDDEPFIVQGLSALIDWEKEGFEIVGTAGNGSEAVEFLKSNPVDLILADIKMPVMNGLVFLKYVRETHLSEAFFVILSGYGDFTYAKEAIKWQCTDYILKPIQKSQLLALLS